MAYTVTYSSLKTEVQAIVDSDNPEFIAQLDNIIWRAQDIVQRDLDLAIWRTFENHHVSAGNKLYARQNTWLKVHSFFLVDVGSFVEQRSLDYVRMYGTAKGVPKYWCERDEASFQLAPIPLLNYNVEVEVNKKLDPLSATNTENWITRNAADLLLLQTLIGSEAFLVSPERVQEFMGMYSALVQSALSGLRGTAKPEYTPTRAASMPVEGA